MEQKIKTLYITASLIFVLILLCFTKAYPQESTASFYADISVSGTYLMPHHKKMGHLVSGHYLYPEISLLKKTKGNKYWHALFREPLFGVSLHYNNFAGNTYTEKAFAVYPFVVLPQYKGHKHTLSLRFGSGLGYISKPFDRMKNPKNVAISTPVNICIVFGLEWEQQIAQNLKTYQSLQMVHFSKGALKMPNTGINLPSLTIGGRYLLPVQMKDKEKASLPEFNSRIYPSIFFAGGAGEIYPVGGKKYPAYSMGVSTNFQPSLKRNFALSLDLFYSTSNFASLDKKNINTTPVNILRPGVSISQELIFGKTAFVFLLGHYLYALEDRDGKIYNRFGYRFNLNDKLYFNLTLKSHLFRAEFIEWGIGYRFLKNGKP